MTDSTDMVWFSFDSDSSIEFLSLVAAAVFKKRTATVHSAELYHLLTQY